MVTKCLLKRYNLLIFLMVVLSEDGAMAAFSAAFAGEGSVGACALASPWPRRCGLWAQPV